MKKYLLLRNNQETGPHSIEQLGSIGLFAQDLIWIESESTSWKYPGEIEELKKLVNQEGTVSGNPLPMNKNGKIFIPLPNDSNRKYPFTSSDDCPWLVVQGEQVLKRNMVKPLERFKENLRTPYPKKPIWNKKMFSSFQAANIAAIFMGVVLGAFVIKKMVDGYTPSSLEEETAATPIIDREVEKQPDPNIKNALVTEIVPVYKTAPAKTAKRINLKKLLRVSSNSYKVGLFGGINGLQLTVFNLSEQPVDKVIVTVDYLKPNGTVVQSGNISFSSIKPKGTQTIVVPDSNRGVKLRYKILKVYAHNYKEDLKEA